MIQPNPKRIVRLQFNRQARKFSSWSVTKNLEYADLYYGFCGMTPEDRLLDISCGSGEFCIFCAQNITHATGVDLSDEMIALAKQQSKESGSINTTFQRCDAVSLPYKSETFSIVISKSAFHHYSDYHTIFREMKRCCSQQGKISIQDIIAYDDKEINEFFESFERLVDKSHKVTCSKSFIRELYQRHSIEILSEMEVAIDLNLNDYFNHAVRSDKDTVRLRQLIKAGLKDRQSKITFTIKGC